MFDMVDVCMNIFAHTNRNEAIVKCVVETADYYDHSLCIFDVDNASTSLESLSVCAFCTSSSNTFVNTKCIRVHRLNRASGLVAEVECALVAPLRLAGNATREAESFPIGIYNLEAS